MNCRKEGNVNHRGRERLTTEGCIGGLPKETTRGCKNYTGTTEGGEKANYIGRGATDGRNMYCREWVRGDKDRGEMNYRGR